MKIKYTRLFPKRKKFELRTEQITDLYVGGLDSCACGCEGTYYSAEKDMDIILKYYQNLKSRKGSDVFGHFAGNTFILECRNGLDATFGFRFYVDLTLPIA